jgi:uncharacterized damage-inducible protein DinB
MLPTDPLKILLEHDKWATRQIIFVCGKLSPEQFARQFEMGRGSLQATLTHMIAAINAWSDTLARGPSRPRVDGNGIAYSTEQLLVMFDSAVDEFATLAQNHPVAEIVTREREGKQYHFSRGVVITHVATHGMHHRAQCLNMLRQLGVGQLPPSSVVEWARISG